MKKKYLKPEAEYVSFYSEEEITLSLSEGVASEGASGSGGIVVGSGIGSGEAGWT